MLVVVSQRGFDAERSHNAPAGPSFVKRKGATENSTANRIPTKRKLQRPGQKKDTQDDGTEEGCDAANETSSLTFGVKIALGHEAAVCFEVYQAVFLG
tara:strand:- start:964 stop:1257 length:294 start_codon:yes stop_codon:yes gene_type:complete